MFKLDLRLYLVISALFSVANSNVAIAGNWQFSPEVSLRETYSDNIMLVSEGQVEQEDYVTEVIPALEIQGTGKRLDVTINYRLQNIYYSKDTSSNQNNSQFLLGAEVEVLENWFFLELAGEQGQKSISNSSGLSIDNLSPSSGRDDFITTTVAPVVKHSFGRGFDLEVGHSVNKIRYDDSSIADVQINRDTFRLNRPQGLSRLSWTLSYDQDEQIDGNLLSSERETSRGLVRYRVLNHLSIIANGGREAGSISGADSFQEGSYWSAGFLWTPSSRFSINFSSGEKDQQGGIIWAPTARTLLEIAYVDRDVGVRSSSEWSGSFSHRMRRTTWLLSYAEEISNDSRIQLVGQALNLVLNESEEAQLELVDLYDITNEEFTRAYAQVGFSYKSKKNDVDLAFTQEQRDYELTARHGETNGIVASWSHHLSARTQSSVLYSYNRKKEDSLDNISVGLISLGLSKEIGRQTQMGLEYRQAVSNQNNVSGSYAENRLSINIKMEL